LAAVGGPFAILGVASDMDLKTRDQPRIMIRCASKGLLPQIAIPDSQRGLHNPYARVVMALKSRRKEPAENINRFAWIAASPAVAGKYRALRASKAQAARPLAASEVNAYPTSAVF
jgi:hypothetical protein